jgi:outer membrane protein TolC
VLKQRSDYQVSVENKKMAELQTHLSRSGYLPQIALGVKERFGTTQINIDGKASWTTTLYAQINIPIFHWGALRQENRKNRTREITQELERIQLMDQVNKELSHSWTQLEEVARRWAIIYSSLAIAQDNLQLNSFSYNEGKLPVLDVLSAQLAWIQAHSRYIEVMLQKKLAGVEYLKAVGLYGKIP